MDDENRPKLKPSPIGGNNNVFQGGKIKRFLLLICLFGIAFFATASALAGIGDGLVAYYPFNGNAHDESGNGNDGTPSGATLTSDRFGKPNSAFSFDGSDYIRVSDNAELDLTTSWTISLWMKLGTIGDHNYPLIMAVFRLSRI